MYCERRARGGALTTSDKIEAPRPWRGRDGCPERPFPYRHPSSAAAIEHLPDLSGDEDEAPLYSRRLPRMRKLFHGVVSPCFRGWAVTARRRVGKSLDIACPRCRSGFLHGRQLRACG